MIPSEFFTGKRTARRYVDVKSIPTRKLRILNSKILENYCRPKQVLNIKKYLKNWIAMFVKG